MIEPGLSLGEFGSVVTQVDDFEVEVGLEDGDLSKDRDERGQNVVISLRECKDLVGSEWSIEMMIPNEIEVIHKERGDEDFTGSIDNDELRVQFLSECRIGMFDHHSRPTDHLVVPLDLLLLLVQIPLQEDRSDLAFPFLD